MFEEGVEDVSIARLLGGIGFATVKVAFHAVFHLIGGFLPAIEAFNTY